MSNNPITAENLRELATVVQRLPLTVPQPDNIDTMGRTLGLKWYLFSDEDHEAQKDTARQIVKAIGGKWDKREANELFWFERTDGPVRFEVIVSRPAVCERVVVGLEERVIPAQEAKPAQPERVEEVEKVEWRCKPLLADDAEDAA